MTNEFSEEFENDDSGAIARLRARAAKLKQKSSKARTRMFPALNVALLSMIGQAIAGNLGVLLGLLALLFLMGIGADYYSEKRLWTFSFFKDSWNCLISGWKERLHIR